MLFWIVFGGVCGMLVGYRLARLLQGPWGPEACLRRCFPELTDQDDQNLRLLHDMLYAKIGFTPLRSYSYTSLEIDHRSFRVEVFFGPKGVAACMHLLLERGVAIPVRVVGFPYSTSVDEWTLPDWSYLIAYLARGTVPDFYRGATEYITIDGEREWIEEFSIGNMENSDRLSESPLLSACHERWLAEERRRKLETVLAEPAGGKN